MISIVYVINCSTGDAEKGKDKVLKAFIMSLMVLVIPQSFSHFSNLYSFFTIILILV